MVCEEKRAVWIASQLAAGAKNSLDHYADAVCVPLVGAGKVLALSTSMSTRPLSAFAFRFLHFAGEYHGGGAGGARSTKNAWPRSFSGSRKNRPATTS